MELQDAIVSSMVAIIGALVTFAVLSWRRYVHNKYVRSIAEEARKKQDAEWRSIEPTAERFRRLMGISDPPKIEVVTQPPQTLETVMELWRMGVINYDEMRAAASVWIRPSLLIHGNHSSAMYIDNIVRHIDTADDEKPKNAAPSTVHELLQAVMQRHRLRAPFGYGDSSWKMSYATLEFIGRQRQENGWFLWSDDQGFQHGQPVKLLGFPFEIDEVLQFGTVTFGNYMSANEPEIILIDEVMGITAEKPKRTLETADGDLLTVIDADDSDEKPKRLPMPLAASDTPSRASYRR